MTFTSTLHDKMQKTVQYTLTTDNHTTQSKAHVTSTAEIKAQNARSVHDQLAFTTQYITQC